MSETVKAGNSADHTVHIGGLDLNVSEVFAGIRWLW